MIDFLFLCFPSFLSQRTKSVLCPTLLGSQTGQDYRFIVYLLYRTILSLIEGYCHSHSEQNHYALDSEMIELNIPITE